MCFVGHCDLRSDRVLSAPTNFPPAPFSSHLVRHWDRDTGALWGLFLEAFQLTLYPDWLGIRFVDEFVRISALSHLAYGASLGLIARWGFRQTGPP